MSSSPKARLTVVTIGVSEIGRSVAFYDALGFQRKFSNDQVAFYETGASVLALFGWDNLAKDAALSAEPRPQGFRGVTLAWNCSSNEEVDATLAFVMANGATMLKPAHATFYGGYSGYFADPDGHAWEVVVAPGIEVLSDGRVSLPG